VLVSDGTPEAAALAAWIDAETGPRGAPHRHRRPRCRPTRGDPQAYRPIAASGRSPRRTLRCGPRRGTGARRGARVAPRSRPVRAPHAGCRTNRGGGRERPDGSIRALEARAAAPYRRPSPADDEARKARPPARERERLPRRRLRRRGCDAAPSHEARVRARAREHDETIRIRCAPRIARARRTRLPRARLRRHGAPG
jgi:hypothetical protein